MCGIAGQWHHQRGEAVSTAELAAMRDAQTHRGPNDAGLWVDGAVGLAHRRLSILDLSEAGRQPMGRDGIQVVFNGEIYNYQELRSWLEERGHRFATTSDTEVLAPLYLELGLDFVQRLRGMFAIALWDGRRERLLLVRDRFGKKPLIYAQTPRGLSFASEMQGLLQDPAVEREVDVEAFDAFLALKYVPAPATIFRAVRKVRPGHLVVVEGGALKEHRYWHPSYLPKEERSEAEWVEHILAGLRESVRLRMIADVPLGAFLSGGIDSSAVVALMSEVSDRPVKTFSIGFEEARYNELDAARAVARHFSTDHHEHIVRMDAVEVLPKLVRHYGEPYADPSALPTYYLCQMTREHVTVALSGDAGDELFAGYGTYRQLRVRQQAARIPAPLRRASATFLSPLVDGNVERRIWWRRLRNTLRESLAPIHEQHYVLNSTFRDADRCALYSAGVAEQLNGHQGAARVFEMAYGETDATDPIERATYADISTYLPDDILTKVDIASMAHSLEVRCPFLDHLFAEQVLRMPFGFKLRGPTTKYIMRRTLERLLPREILERPKQGFAVPLDPWFRNELADFARDLLFSERCATRGYFRPEAVTQLLDDHLNRRRNHGRLLWSLSCLELWFREVVDVPLEVVA